MKLIALVTYPCYGFRAPFSWPFLVLCLPLFVLVGLFEVVRRRFDMWDIAERAVAELPSPIRRKLPGALSILRETQEDDYGHREGT